MQTLFSSNAAMSSDAALFPQIPKKCRLFKEIAEGCISQLEFLLDRGYIQNKEGEHHYTGQSFRDEAKLSDRLHTFQHLEN